MNPRGIDYQRKANLFEIIDHLSEALDTDASGLRNELIYVYERAELSYTQAEELQSMKDAAQWNL